MTDPVGAAIHITGIVQGVGFRPFVYNLALRLGLTGWVRNTSAGVDIQVSGPEASIQQFVQALQQEAPPLAQIFSLEVTPCPAQPYASFEIEHSQAIPDAFQPISPDVATCPDCLRELNDPADRRYRYPFINCTNCGPRFTIITDIPYDRPNTTMADFPLCPECRREYEDPRDRRFHAQPVACPVCGPEIWLEERRDGTWERVATGDQALLLAQQRLRAGQILAIRGLGGFHLACDAENPAAVQELRRRKLRVDKPFALMMPDLETISRHCTLSAAEIALLQSPARPIVILHRRAESTIAPQVAPGQQTLGVMLPYTPLHTLLFQPQQDEERLPGAPAALVMTSGNLSEEPIATDNEEARQNLGSLCDAFLMHNRPIRTRCDDSVVRMVSTPNGGESLLPLRRSRGYTPFPVPLPWTAPPLLAVGAELKNTFCLTRQRYAILSHHIGDLENLQTLRSFEDGVAHFERLFRLRPAQLVMDLHPDYLSTQYARQRAEQEGLPLIGVQHHHAHIAACMAEHNLPLETQVIGVSFDGTGYGLDGEIWGGEFLIAGYREFQRPYHLAYVPLPGGAKAIHEPWRMALAWLQQSGLPWSEDLPPIQFVRQLTQPEQRLQVLAHQIAHRLNAPLTSSMGRLFDAAASLLGVKHTINYEAQAAIELEALAERGASGFYPIPMPASDPASHTPPPGSATPIPLTALLEGMIADWRRGEAIGAISTRFHRSLAQLVLAVCRRLRQSSGLNTVALSGGVWQNIVLFTLTLELLQADGFTVIWHQRVPPNDGGIALGQAAVASALLVSDSGA